MAIACPLAAVANLLFGAKLLWGVRDQSGLSAVSDFLIGVLMIGIWVALTFMFTCAFAALPGTRVIRTADRTSDK